MKALWLAIACGGCALVSGPPPQIEVAAVELRGAGLLDQALGVTLCVTNPNTADISFRRITVAASLEGQPLAEGVSETPVRVPAGASVLVPFSVGTTTQNLGPQMIGILRSGVIDYRLRGGVTLEAIGITVPFSRSGRLGLLQAGSSLLQDVQAPDASRCTL